MLIHLFYTFAIKYHFFMLEKNFNSFYYIFFGSEAQSGASIFMESVVLFIFYSSIFISGPFGI